MRDVCLAAALFLLAATAQPAAEPSLRAQRVTEAIRVDGRLDEAAWGAAPTASGFRQKEPDEGQPATEATEVRSSTTIGTSTSGCAPTTASPTSHRPHSPA